MKNGRENDLYPDQTGLYRTQTDLYGKTLTDIYRGYDTDYDESRQTDGAENGGEPEEQEERPARKRKKRRKKHYFLRFLLVLLAGGAVYAFLTSSVFVIDKIEIEGNTIISDDDIIEQSGAAEGDNLFKVSGHKVRKALKKNCYIADADIDRKLPDTLTITITERVPVIAMKQGAGYIILDGDGYVLDEADSVMYATLVTGLDVTEYKVGEIPEFEDSARFKEVSRLIKNVNDSGMFFKKVEVEPALTVKGYITDTLMCEGTSEDIAGSLEEIKAVLYDLNQKGVKRGIIQIEGSDSISFSPITE